MNIVSQEVIAEILDTAEKSPRRRSHKNFHATLEDSIHRLLIGAMPDTVFPVHRHRNKFELFVLLHGEVEAILTDDEGNVTKRMHMTPDGEYSALENEPGMWHTYKILKPSVILEVKPGPYQPITPEDTLDVVVE